MAMMTITIVFAKYIPLVLNFKAYFLEYGFIFFIFFFLVLIFTPSAQSRTEISLNLNKVDLGILLKSLVMDNIIYDLGTL